MKAFSLRKSDKHIISYQNRLLEANPKGRLGMANVSLLSGISGVSFDSPFISLSFFLPSPLALSVLSLFC